MLIDTRIKINGTDITNLIAFNGVKWSRYDVDGPNAGRTMSGLMVRDRVATKVRLDITCRIMNSDELRTLLNLILPDFITVTYDDPQDGLVTRTMYSNNNSAQFYMRKASVPPEQLWYAPIGTPVEYWDGVTFPLIER